jgi:metal-responsive CopG/Arc/MetJ family transcriptional regulator
MKVKTSITISEDLLEAIDRHAETARNRSVFIETAVRAYLAKLAREERDTRDLSIISRHAERLNREAADVLEFQKIP